MPKRSEFADYIVETLTGLCQKIHAKAMFGGFGVYCNDQIFAIIVEDVLYFKADKNTEANYQAKMSKKFSYQRHGKTIFMSYYEAPADMLDDPELLLTWARENRVW